MCVKLFPGDLNPDPYPPHPHKHLYLWSDYFIKGVQWLLLTFLKLQLDFYHGKYYC